MQFTSTRSAQNFSSSQAITQGLAADGGLFVPQSFPQLDAATLSQMVNLNYRERAKIVLQKFLTDYTEEEIDHCVEAAYTGNFDNDEPAPLHLLEPGVNLLELWHGPTCAFKDMALQLLPHLLTTAAKKVAPDQTMVILVATSGDTGKAALAGFADVPQTKIIVFYPQNGVSHIQQLQMTTQTGNNVAVCAIEGNFDHAQSGVKAIFADQSMREFLAQSQMEFSSANSINFGRLVPQIVYYVSSYCDLLKSGQLNMGDQFNVAVPTGNFGNILAAFYAKQMGIPIAKFICASNSNHILTDFISSGVYDRNREFFTTISPSMDILISSNLERLLYFLYDNDAPKVADLMQQLKSTGRYAVSPAVLKKLQQEFACGYATEDDTRATIKALFDEHHYLCDTHTAVAVNVYRKYRAATGDATPTVIASTASPYKFVQAVLESLAPEQAQQGDEFELAAKLAKLTGTTIPAPLANLKSRPVLHSNCVAKTAMADFIKDFLAK